MTRRITASASNRTARRVVAAGCVALVPLAFAACTSKDTEGADAVAVTSSDSACELSTTEAKTGAVVFTVKNDGGKVTEFYVYGKNNRVLGEVENIGPGASAKLTVEIAEAGDYETACKPGMVGNGIRKTIKVSGDKKEFAARDDVKAAKAQYIEYVKGQVDGLVTATTTWVGYVKSGDLDAARREFGRTRTFFERIEPVAESFETIDPQLDMRWEDTEDGKQEFIGFHRIERFLFPPTPDRIGEGEGKISPADAADAKAKDTKANIDAIADRLLVTAKELQTEVNKPDFAFEDQSFVNGPHELVTEVAKTKITGEEDRYSQTDLWDVYANLEGSERLITDMAPLISKKNQALMDKITAQFAAARDFVDARREGDGFASYKTVTPEQRRELSTKIDALTASLSQVPGIVLG